MTDYTKESGILKALAHPIRLRMVEGLLGKECSVKRMVTALDMPQSTVSQHLGILRSRGIVTVRKEGVTTCYRVVDPRIRGLMKIIGRGAGRAAAVLIFLLAICASGTVQAAEEPGAAPLTLTFDHFCRRVLEHYPKLKEQGASVEVAIAQKFRALAGYMPRIQAMASMTAGNDQVYVFGTLLRQRAFAQSDFALSQLNDPDPRTNYNIGLHGEMPLFDALQTAYKVKSAKYMVMSARYDEFFSRSEAILIATDAYLHAIATRDLLGIVEEECKNSAEDIKQAEELKQKGMVLGADFYAAKVTLGNLNSIKNDLEGQMLRDSALLNILMGDDPLGPVIISESLPGGKETRSALKDWLAEAARSRPDLKSIDEAIRAGEADHLRERLSALPKVSAFGDLNENTHDFETGGGSFAVGLKGSIDIFEPDYFARVKSARGSLRKMEHERGVVKDAITKEVTDEYTRFESFKANIPVLLEMKSDSGEALKLTLPLYREGRKSIADLLGMRRSYVETNRHYYGLVAGSRTSWASLLFLSGQLDESRASQIVKGGE
ncbi:MAG: metalloregulator ArsR/SmtB family transcription factor [Candidatus Omnitrophota bacterium]